MGNGCLKGGEGHAARLPSLGRQIRSAWESTCKARPIKSRSNLAVWRVPTSET